MKDQRRGRTIQQGTHLLNASPCDERWVPAPLWPAGHLIQAVPWVVELHNSAAAALKGAGSYPLNALPSSKPRVASFHACCLQGCGKTSQSVTALTSQEHCLAQLKPLTVRRVATM